MPSPRVDAILQKHGFKRDAQTTWKVQGNDVIYHHVLELIAIDLEIEWLPPQILRCEADEAVILVQGRMDGKLQWTIGEARVDANYRVSGKQAAYVYAMAEKRGKDRLIYKFLGLADATEPEDMGKPEEPKQPEKPVSEMTVLEKFKHNILRKKTEQELAEWLKSEPVRLALERITDVERRQVMHWANEHSGKLAEQATSQPEGIWVPYLEKTRLALAKARNEQEVNSYESMLKEQEFAEAPADVLQAFAELCEGRRYALRTR